MNLVVGSRKRKETERDQEHGKRILRTGGPGRGEIHRLAGGQSHDLGTMVQLTIGDMSSGELERCPAVQSSTGLALNPENSGDSGDLKKEESREIEKTIRERRKEGGHPQETIKTEIDREKEKSREGDSLRRLKGGRVKKAKVNREIKEREIKKQRKFLENWIESRGGNKEEREIETEKGDKREGGKVFNPGPKEQERTLTDHVLQRPKTEKEAYKEKKEKSERDEKGEERESQLGHTVGSV